MFTFTDEIVYGESLFLVGLVLWYKIGEWVAGAGKRLLGTIYVLWISDVRVEYVS
jgi:hypothetical protein